MGGRVEGCRGKVERFESASCSSSAARCDRAAEVELVVVVVVEVSGTVRVGDGVVCWRLKRTSKAELVWVGLKRIGKERGWEERRAYFVGYKVEIWCGEEMFGMRELDKRRLGDGRERVGVYRLCERHQELSQCPPARSAKCGYE
jgi:hypothetical protein